MKKTYLKSIKHVTLLLAGLAIIHSSLACTAVNVVADDGSVIAGRTMEWAFDMQWQLIILPAGTHYQLSAPADLNLPVHKQTSRYAIAGIGAGVVAGTLLEGQNSAGLGMSGNFLPGFTQYQTVNKQDKKYVSIVMLGQFILGNFATVAEVTQALQNYKVWSPTHIVGAPTPPTIHFVFSDKSGKSIVVEYTKGKLNVFNNDAKVLTNSPPYDWQIINLRNYLNISNTGVNFKKIGDGDINQIGQGGGSIGLPGDYTPPSRFVKTTFLNYYATKPQTATAATQLVGHILNNVDIPLGIVNSTANGKTYSDYTQWVAIKDLSHNKLDFADYQHRLNFVSIDLDRVFAEKKSMIIPIEKLTYPSNDVTNSVLRNSQ